MVSQASQLLALECGSMRGALRVYNQGTAPDWERDWRLPARKIDRVWRHKRGIPGATAYLRPESCCESVFATFHHGCADAEKLLPAFPARGTGGQRIRSSSHSLHLFLRRARGLTLYCHALYTRWNTLRLREKAWPVVLTHGPVVYFTDCRGARLCPQAWLRAL